MCRLRLRTRTYRELIEVRWSKLGWVGHTLRRDDADNTGKSVEELIGILRAQDAAERHTIAGGEALNHN